MRPRPPLATAAPGMIGTRRAVALFVLLRTAAGMIQIVGLSLVAAVLAVLLRPNQFSVAGSAAAAIHSEHP